MTGGVHIQAQGLNSLRGRVLIVDDDRTTCLVLRRILLQDGYEVAVARNGTEAIQLCRSGTQDLILLDYMLPDMDGAQVCASIRNEQNHGDTPILVLTSRNDDAAVKTALDAGANDFITKPFLAPALRQRVRHIVAARGAERLLRYMAYHDPLTGLANRALLLERLNALAVQQEASPPYAVLCMDLDRFKIVNDAGGHSAGDELLRQLSGTLQHKLRETDLLARLGGDEFAALLVDCSKEDALAVAEKLRRAVSEFAFHWQGRTFMVGLSVGIAMVMGEGELPANVLADADSACYSAKNSGRNRVSIHEPKAGELRRRRADANWRDQIERALTEDRIALSAQRICSVPAVMDGPQNVEIQVALIDHDGSTISPAVFRGPAERHGLMPSIDRWVISNTFRQLQQHITPSGQTFLIWIPISGMTLVSSDFSTFVFEQLTRFNLSPSTICFQICEEFLLSNTVRASEVLRTLALHQVSIAVDEFSGLVSFRTLPHESIHFLKIDSSLLGNVAPKGLDFALTKAIIDVAHAVNIKVVAKLDKTEELQNLCGLGVDLARVGFETNALRQALMNGRQQDLMVSQSA